MLYWQTRLYSFYCWLQEQCWSITLTQDTSSPHILASMTEMHSANRIICLPTVNLVYEQDSWKQVAEGDKRLITNMWIHMAVMAFQLKAWDGNRQKNSIVRSHEWQKNNAVCSSFVWCCVVFFFFLLFFLFFWCHVNRAKFLI